MQNANDIYQRNQVNTARPEELTLMLYSGAIKFLNQGKLALQKNDLAKVNSSLLKVQDIITELMSTLNMDYEISHSLLSLYEYMKRRLIEGNIKKDLSILAEIEDMLKELRTVWSQAINVGKTS
jgi:flagellar secretion chaperone FliS